jgi:hypothetical protein
MHNTYQGYRGSGNGKWILAKFAEFEYAGDELGEILQGAEIG